MKISQEIWNDLLTTPSIHTVTQIKYIDNEWLNELIHYILNGSYDKIFIENPNLRDFINKNHDDSQWTEIMDKLNHDEELADLLHIIIGIAYLQLFIINNFLGPKCELDNLEIPIPQSTINEQLTCDGEIPVATIEHLDYLYQATKIFNISQNQTNKNWTWYWWTMRTLFTHQKMLDEHSMTLYNNIQTCIDNLFICQPDMNKTQQTLFSIEIAYIFAYYYNWKQVEVAKNQAIQISGLEINLTGQLGKRTRYQINDTSQLLLDITRNKTDETLTNNNNNSIATEENLILPKNMALNDDVVLNQIQFKNETDNQNLTIQLNIIEQLTLLFVIYDRQINNPRHEITTEEQLAFLTVCI